jgi:hypothetical protein
LSAAIPIILTELKTMGFTSFNPSYAVRQVRPEELRTS